MNKKRIVSKLIKFAVSGILTVLIVVVPVLDLGKISSFCFRGLRADAANAFNDTVVKIGFSNGESYDVREMLLEDYLIGVVFAEIGNNYPLEAIKAQAIVARTFTLMNLSRHSDDGFALCGSSHCQAYRDLSTMSESSYANVKQAVEETAGQVILYNGEMVPVYYFASSGGHTMNIEDVWTAAYPYLRSVKDDFCSGYEWQFEMSFEEIAEKMEAHDYTVGTITSIEVSQECDNGAVKQLLVKSVSDSGEVFENTITKSNIGSVLGGSNFKSNFFSMTGSSENATREELQGGLYVQGASSHNRSDDTVWVLGADGSPVEAGFNELNVIFVQDASSMNGKDKSIETISDTGGLSKVGTEYVFEREVVTDGKIFVSGVGNGHGIGLPQTSARNMANEGYSAEEILKYYFTGIDVAAVQ